MNSHHAELLLAAYEAFNRQDATTLLSLISEDVDWPDNSDRLHGKRAVEAYWLKEWSEFLPHDTPVEMRDVSSDTTIVQIEQMIFNLDGSVRSTGRFEHTYKIRGGLIERMDITKL